MRAIIAAALAAITVPALASEWRDQAVEEILTEPKVVEAMFTQDLSLWVSVRDDGSSRDGFAEYLCLVLSDFRPPDEPVIISIWDAAAMARDEMKRLGRNECG